MLCEFIFKNLLLKKKHLEWKFIVKSSAGMTLGTDLLNEFIRGLQGDQHCQTAHRVSF